MTPTPQIPSNPTLTDLLVALVRLESKVDGFTGSHDDHETRIRALEQRRWPIQSAALVMSVVAAGVSAVGLVMR